MPFSIFDIEKLLFSEEVFPPQSGSRDVIKKVLTESEVRRIDRAHAKTAKTTKTAPSRHPTTSLI
jgi:hypothetical protein